MKLLKYMVLILFVIVIIIFYKFCSSIDTSGYKDPSLTEVIEVFVGDVKVADQRRRFYFYREQVDQVNYYHFPSLINNGWALPDISGLTIDNDPLKNGRLFLMDRDRFPLSFMQKILKDIEGGNAESLTATPSGFNGYQLPYYPEQSGFFTYVLDAELDLTWLRSGEVYVTCRGIERMRFDGALGPFRNCRVHAPITERSRIEYSFADDAPWSPEYWSLMIKIIDHTLGQRILIEDKKSLNIEPTQH